MKACQKGFNPTYQEEGPTIEQVGDLIGYAVIEFGTPWCGHCKEAIPAIRQVLSGRKISHIKVVDGKEKSLGRLFKVKLWPTLILLDSGREVARLVRPINASEVLELISHAR